MKFDTLEYWLVALRLPAGIILGVFCVLLSGCDIPSSNGRYQFSDSVSGLYLSDTRTGAIWQCWTKTGCKQISPPIVQ
jgi:hypothetical protein